jgi:methionyl aminopeptidase
VIILKSSSEIDRMRTACKIAYEVLQSVAELVSPGVTTYDLDQYAASEAKKRKAKCAFKGYHNYPNSLCCSPNNQVVHGLPTKECLKSGDILSLDFGVFINDFFGDAAVTVPVGDVSSEALRLIEITEKSLYAGIESAVNGNRLGDISYSVQSCVEQYGYSVVRDFVGHGIGRSLHEDPQVPNYGSPGKGIRLKPGMVLAIEPMINQGTYDVRVLDDKWTVVTADGKLSAHFEHTVAITDKGPEILTHI